MHLVLCGFLEYQHELNRARLGDGRGKCRRMWRESAMSKSSERASTIAIIVHVGKVAHRLQVEREIIMSGTPMFEGITNAEFIGQQVIRMVKSDDSVNTKRVIGKFVEQEITRPKTKLFCSVCGERQFETCGGLVCKNGHGGAPSI